MKRIASLFLLVIVSFCGGCVDRREKVDDLSMNVPWFWEEDKGVYKPEDAMSPDGQVYNPSSRGFMVPKFLWDIPGVHYAAVVVVHYQIKGSNTLLYDLDGFYRTIIAGQDTLEKGKAEFNGKKALWCLHRVYTVTANEQRQEVSGKQSDGSNDITVSGYTTRTSEIGRSFFRLDYWIKKRSGDFYQVSFQAREKAFPSQRPLFEKLADTIEFE